MSKQKIQFVLFIISIVSFFASCDANGPFGPGLLKDAKAQSNPVQSIVFVPGYKGSELVKKEGDSWNKIWLTPRQALGLSHPDLSYKEGDAIQEGGVLGSVTLIPKVIDVQVYSPWLEALRSSNLKPYVFPYDWRRDNGETSKHLESFLEKVKSENGNIAPIVVGHSNGGNLTLSVLNRRPDLIGKAVFVGTPFHSGIGFMEDLIPGVSTGLNGKIAGACVVSTFVSVLTFFPRNQSFDTKEVLTTLSGEPIQVEFFQAKDWKRLQLGIYNKASGCASEPSLESYQSNLDKALSFRNSLEPKKKGKLPSVLVVHATNRPTLRTLPGEKKAEDWIWYFEKGKRVPGDGRVTAESSLPPEGIPYELFVSEAEHSALLNDPKVQQKILEFAEKR
ncbi:alpha/beta hydrolase [Leptospira semungkisensis]|uniref:Alpha/beta hydrolase n=1 Tax=Leptospira semungkisensis TaxID=2484985 RepID=A0A4R9G5K1_9LEPT|nr:alpha/beta hydrolase [Leptospira semungkisensis]TGK06663.1 alpha/beta hydrolase [Leptospira semungkisensis]